MSIIRQYVSKIDLQKFYQPVVLRNKYLSVRNISCITCNNHQAYAKSQDRRPRSFLPNLTVGRLALSTASSRYQESTPVKQWKYKLSPFGKLVLNSSSIDCSISPIDPNDYPEQDLVVVSLHGASQGDESVSCELQGEDVHVSQIQEAQGNNLELKVPIKYGVSAVFSDQSNLEISTMENENINVQMEKGTCTLKNIKSGRVNVSSKSGDIISKKTLQGNSTLKTGQKGVIDLNKPVCNDLCVETESGDIKVTSLYAAHSYFNTRRGNVGIGSCHKETMVNIQHMGNLNIGTLDGNLLASVTHGDVDVHITQHKNVQVLVSKGDISIKMAKSDATQVELRAHEVDIAEDIDTEKLQKQSQGEQHFFSGSIGEEVPASLTDSTPTSIVATTGDGSITVAKEGWMAALRQKYNNSPE